MTVVLMAFEVRRGMGESSPFLTLWEEDRERLPFSCPCEGRIGEVCPFFGHIGEG